MTESRPWRWRNCRGLELGFWLVLAPWDWRLLWHVINDHTMFHGTAQLGPFNFQVFANIGNNSSEGWGARFGLSEEEAWDRSE